MKWVYYGVGYAQSERQHANRQLLEETYEQLLYIDYIKINILSLNLTLTSCDDFTEHRGAP